MYMSIVLISVLYIVLAHETTFIMLIILKVLHVIGTYIDGTYVGELSNE